MKITYSPASYEYHYLPIRNVVKQDQKYYFGRFLINQSGQAVIEFILLIVVVVSLIFGVKKAFNNVDEYMSRYIGDYITCLMEYGELPSLGVADADQKKHLDGSGRKCDDSFAGFTFEDGRPPVGGGPGGTGGTGTGSTGGSKNNSSVSGSKNSSSSASKGGSNKGKSGSGSDSDSGDDEFGAGRKNSSSGRQSSPYTKGEITRGGGKPTADASDESSTKVRVLEEDEEAKRKKRDSRSAFSRSMRGGYGRDKYRAITGTMLAEMEKRAPRKPRAPVRSVATLKTDDGDRFKPYRKTFIPPEPKKIAEKESDNSGLSFGYFIRWLIIGAMVLAIIVFFGGQIMNYSNSKD